MKTLCPIHCFRYSGVKCPFCEKERINRMVNKFENKQKERIKTEVKSNEVTQDDIERLKNKFNNK